MYRTTLLVCLFSALAVITECQAEMPNAPAFQADISYVDPVINSGPLSFGLSGLPAEVNATISLSAGFPTGGGATGFGLDEVISANLIFGDVIGPNNLMAFDMEIDADGAIEALSYTFSPFDTPSVSDGGIVMNSPLFISGTDIASGQAFSYTYANSTATVTAVPAFRSDVTYSDPVINSGPLSFGLSELPAKVTSTFSLSAGFPTGGGATGWGLDEVISANLIFGDVIGPNNLMAFDLEIDADGSIEAFSYTYSPFDTPSVSDGSIVLNSPLFITGTDIASGQAFSYTYANSTATVTSVPAFTLGDANDDGVLNNLDIASFVLALTDQKAYQAMFPDVDTDVVLDMNCDGGFDNLDIAGFVAALTGGKK